jgi:glucosylceramidase
MLFWNLALDQDAGPFKGGCMTCRGVVTIDSVRRKFRRNDEYYALAHFSRFVARGAVRIGSSGSSDGVDNVAFLAPDGGSVILIASNRSRKARRLRIQQGALQFEHQVPKRSIVTYRWPLSVEVPADPVAGGDR